MNKIDSKRIERNKQINILMLKSIFHLGGAEKITFDIISMMNKDKFNIILCSLYHPGPMGEVFINNNYKMYHNLMRNKFDISAFSKLKKIIIENNIDIIYLNTEPLTLFWGFMMGKIFRIPILPVIHNTVVTKERAKLRIYKLLLPFVSSIITVANMQKRHLVINENLPEKLITVINNGINISKFDIEIDKEKKLKALGLDTSNKTVGIVSRLVHLKGIDIFLHAAHSVLQLNDNVQFLIVGEGPEMLALKKLAADLKIDNKVFFIGNRNDIIEILTTFDIAVLSSRTEALPMVVLEYMASRKPIIATEVGSVPELIIDGESGLLIPPENSDFLAKNIFYLLKNQNLAQKMGNKARQTVCEKFKLEVTVEKYEKLFNKQIVRN